MNEEEAELLKALKVLKAECDTKNNASEYVGGKKMF